MRRHLPDLLALLACLPPAVATAGWSCEALIWASWLPDRPTMKLGTVLALWSLAGAAWVQRRCCWTEAVALGLMATMLVSIGVSGLLVPPGIGPTEVFRGLTSAGTAVGVFLLAAVAIGDAAARRPTFRIRLICGGMAAAVGFLAALGVLTGWAPLYWHGPHGTGVALPTAVSLTCLGAVQVLRSQEGGADV